MAPRACLRYENNNSIFTGNRGVSKTRSRSKKIDFFLFFGHWAEFLVSPSGIWCFASCPRLRIKQWRSYHRNPWISWKTRYIFCCNINAFDSTFYLFAVTIIHCKRAFQRAVLKLKINKHLTGIGAFYPRQRQVTNEAFATTFQLRLFYIL